MLILQVKSYITTSDSLHPLPGALLTRCLARPRPDHDLPHGQAQAPQRYISIAYSPLVSGAMLDTLLPFFFG